MDSPPPEPDAPSGIAFSLDVAPFSRRLEGELGALAVTVFGPLDEADLRWRLDRLPEASLALARDGARLVGFKFGHALSSKRYASWLGGVHPDARRRGIARRLMALQHDWVGERGFESIETSTTRDNAAMLELNRASGFRIIGEYDRDGTPKILHFKRL